MSWSAAPADFVTGLRIGIKGEKTNYNHYFFQFFDFLKKEFSPLRIINKEKLKKICILKNMTTWPFQFRMRPCFGIFDFLIFYANL